MYTWRGLVGQASTTKSWSWYVSIGLAAVVVTLLIGVQSVGAETYDVSAKVQAPLSSQPAVITRPVSGTTTNSASLNVSGDCPVLSPQLIVVLWRENTLLGSVACSPSGHFEIPITLVNGVNVITPKLKNITNDSGVDGQPVQVTYSQSATTTTITKETPVVATPGSSVPPSSPALELVSDEDFLVILPNGEVSITINIRNGEPPYVMLVDWGDGSKTNYAFDSAGKKTVRHSYGSVRMRSIKLVVTDKNGQIVTMVLGAVVATPITRLSKESSDILPDNLQQAWWIIPLVAILGLLFVENYQQNRRVSSKKKSKKVSARKPRGKK